MVEEYSTYPTNIKCYEKIMSIGKGSFSNVIIKCHNNTTINLFIFSILL